MRLFREMPATMETASTGTLKVEARSLVGFRPLPGGTVTIRPTGSEQILEVLQTDESGNKSRSPLRLWNCRWRRNPLSPPTPSMT